MVLARVRKHWFQSIAGHYQHHYDDHLKQKTTRRRNRKINLEPHSAFFVSPYPYYARTNLACPSIPGLIPSLAPGPNRSYLGLAKVRIAEKRKAQEGVYLFPCFLKSQTKLMLAITFATILVNVAGVRTWP